MGDLVLADLPAEEHFLAFVERGEVDQAGVEVLHQHAQPLKSLGRLRDGVRLTLELLVQLAGLLRVEVAYFGATAILSPSQLGYNGGLMGMFGGSKVETAPFKGEPTRESLTQPPPGYQTPSPNFAYGTGPKESLNKEYNPAAGKYGE